MDIIGISLILILKAITQVHEEALERIKVAIQGLNPLTILHKKEQIVGGRKTNDMASLENNTIADTYPLLLKVDANGVDGTLRAVEGGEGTDTALKVSTGAVQVDNIKIDGNTISSTDTDGNIALSPNGSGVVTANITGTAATVTGAAQTSITRVGSSLGIGLAPTHNFNLQAAGTVEARFYSTDGDCSLQIASDTDEGQSSILAFNSATSTRGSVLYDHNATAASQKMQFLTGDNAVTAMTIDGSGKCGIGTASPARPLEVKDSSDVVNIRLQGSVGYCDISGNGGAGSDFVVFPEGTEKFRVKEDGKIGIGTASPSHGLHLVDVTTTQQIVAETTASGSYSDICIKSDTHKWSMSTGGSGTSSAYNDQFYIYDHDNSAQRLVISNSGNVGIGRPAPDSKLHLADTYDGNLRLLRLTNLNQQGNDACGILWQLPRSGGSEFESGEIYVAKENGSWTGTPGTVDSQMIFKVILSESLGTAMTIGSDKEIHGNFDDTSDRSLKKNIKELSSTLDKVNLLKPSSFNWKVAAERNEKNQIGFIAQEVEEQFEELVSAKTVEDVELKSINTIGLVSVLTKAVQELSAKVTALENA